MEKDSKKKRRTIIFLIIFALTIGLFWGFSSKYKTHIQWSLLDTAYVFAVEDDNYNGDKIKAGVYKIEVTMTGQSIPVFDIYVLDHEIGSIRELKNPSYTVGGGSMKQEPIYVRFEKGSYVAIVPYALSDKQYGTLDIKRELFVK